MEEWECGECIGNAVPFNRWPLGVKTKDLGQKRDSVRLLDINSIPISDGEGEGITDLHHSRYKFFSCLDSEFTPNLVNIVVFLIIIQLC